MGESLENLRVEYAHSNLAIDTRHPQFSWEVSLDGRCRAQAAYQILVASSSRLAAPGKADLWDSGRVDSSQSLNVQYEGRKLHSGADYYWCVRIWDENDRPSAFSQAGHFGMGLLEESDWHAQWIGMMDPDEPVSDPAAFQLKRVLPAVAEFDPEPRAPMLRKEFLVDSPVARARACASGVGLFELRLNGQKVGGDVLATPRTDFRKRVFYSTYDVTEQLRSGTNALGLLLGNGWFNGQKKYWGWQMQWFGSPRGIVQLEIEFADGSCQRVVSDGSWRGAWSPISFNCLFDGEEYDARLQQPGWDAPGFNDAGWQSVNSAAAPGGRLVPISHEQERIVESIPPVSMQTPEPGVFVFDLGRNITGWVQLTVKGGKPGDMVTMRFGEAQHENGALNAASNNAARQTDRYTLGSNAEEVYEPRFTFHGFQFVEVTGYPGTPDLSAVSGRFVRTAVSQIGAFECGNELINRIHRCTLQSQMCNVQMGVPTDDTQRPERQGWGADAWGTANEALYNLWMPRVYRKWIRDFCDQQDENGMIGMIAPQAGANEDLVWSSAFLLIPWWQYRHHGDRRILEENYPAMKRYLGFLRKTGVKEVTTLTSEELVEKMMSITGTDERFAREEDRGHLQISQWGDHLSTAEGFVGRSNLPLCIATAFYYLDVSTLEKIARVLGYDEDAELYGALADKIKAAFNERFYDPKVGYYDTGVQSAQAWAIAFGLLDEEQQERVAHYLTRAVGHTQRQLTTGYASTKFAVEALAMLGREDLVWKMATRTDYPSWGFMLRLNRTTSCERWDGEGGSLNHAPLGAAIDEWFYWGLAGIRPDESAPGFERIIFKPYLPPDLHWVRASIETVRGTVTSEWMHDGKEATVSVTVPANCTGTVHIPHRNADAITESGVRAASSDGVELVSTDDQESQFAIGSGTYQFGFAIRPGYNY